MQPSATCNSHSDHSNNEILLIRIVIIVRVIILILIIRILVQIIILITIMITIIIVGDLSYQHGIRRHT